MFFKNGKDNNYNIRRRNNLKKEIRYELQHSITGYVA